MAFSDPDFCLCFLVKVFPRGCQMLIFLVSCGSSCLCLSLSISLSTSVRLSLRMCVPECPTGFFRDDKKRCKKCSPFCESCMGSRSDQCTACRPGLYLMEGGNNCVSSCPDGFYLDLGKSHTSSRSRNPQILICCWIWNLMWLFSHRLHYVPEMQRELQEMHVCEHLHWMPDRSQVIPPIHLLHVFFLGQCVKYSQNLGLKLPILSDGLRWAVKIKPRWQNAELSLETSCYTRCSSWVQMYVEMLSLVSDIAWAFPTPLWRSIKRWKKQREKRKTGHGTKSGVMSSSCSVNGFEIFSEYT